MASPVVQALLDHSQKKLDAAGVMRALVEHDDWHVPSHAITRPAADRLIVYAEKPELAAHQLNIFTDRAAADLAAEKFGRPPMGTYAGGVRGLELFSGLLLMPALAPALMLQVNPGSPIELQWFIERSAFGLCAVWSNAITLERAMGSQSWADAMRRYEGWLVILGKADNAVVRMTIRDKGEHALVFSAPDLADNFLRNLPNNGAANCKQSAVDGEHLFKFLLNSGVKGFIVNGNSPQTRVFDVAACRTIMGA